MLLRVVLPVLTLLLGLACCPIPIPRQGLLRPDLEITVTDAGGAPVPGVEVILRRTIAAPGPATEIARFVTLTDEHGVARFDRAEVTDTVMPLMMHGVPYIDFEICAQTEAASASGWVDAGLEDAPSTLALVLDPAGPLCPPAPAP